MTSALASSFRRAGCAAVAISLGALIGCSSSGSSGTDPNGNGDGGSTADLLNPTPPPGSFRVTVTRGGTGTGTVTSQPAGIDCGGSCNADFVEGTVVTLTPQGQTGAFSGWGGACQGQGGTCTLTLTANLSVTANFDPLTCSPDGLCWEAPLPFGYDLSAVYARAANDVWAVGSAGAIVHYDGKSWQRMNSGTTANLLGVFARAANDAYIAAGSGGLLRYDGTAWSKMNTSAITTGDITGVYGGAAALYVTTRSSDVHRYNGTAWTRYNATALGIRSTALLKSVTGTSDNDVIAYGTEYAAARWNGSTWAAQPAGSVTIDYILALAPNQYYGLITGGLYQYDTTKAGFQFKSVGNVQQNDSTVAGLWGSSATSLFSTGATGLFYRFNGTSWSSLDTGVRQPQTFRWVHGSAANDVWAVSYRGTIVHYKDAAV